MANLELKGRAAIITGAASGIGKALAMEAAARGMSVGIADVNGEALEATAVALRALGATVVSRVVDVRSAEEVADFAAICAESFPSIAEIWANAGVLKYNLAIRPNLADWNFVIDVNLRGVIHCIAAFMPYLLDRAEPAQFIITGSQASFMVSPEIGAYAATKHGLWAIAEGMKQELALENTPVQVSMLAPPRTATAIIATTMERTRAAQGEEGLEKFLQSIPTAEEVALYAMEKAEQRDFLILPHFDDIHEFVAARFGPLIEA